MANNVSFLLGQQETVNDLITAKTGVIAGAFYVTNDTHRMYFGASETELVALNEGVTTVASVADLPSTDQIAGSFYYATKENVLCVWSGTRWVQINPDSYVNSVSAITTAASNIGTVTYTIQDNNGHRAEGGHKLQGVNIAITTGADNKTLILTGNVCSLSVEKSGTAAKVNLNNSEGTADSFIIDAANTNTVINVDADTKKVTIESKDTYVNSFTKTLTQQNESVRVIDALSQVGGISNPSPDSYLTISGDGATTKITANNTTKDISIKANTYEISTKQDGEASAKTVDVDLVQNLDGTTKSTDTIKLTGGTNVKTLTTEQDTVTIDTYDTYVNNFKATALSNGFAFNIEQAGGISNATKEASIDPVVKYGKTELSAHFNNGTADLNVYTIPEVDSLIQSKLGIMDGMHYVGTINQNDYNNIKSGVADGTQAIRKGDTYKVASSFIADTVKQGDTVGNQSCNIGDLLIANGTETLTTIDGVTDYFITSDLYFDYVPSGDDATIYKVEAYGDSGGSTAAKHGISIMNGTQLTGKIEFVDPDETSATPLSISSTVTGGKEIAINVKHDEIGTFTVGSPALTQTTAGSGGRSSSYVLKNVVTDLTKDSWGHILTGKSQDITLYDTHANLKSASTVVAMPTANKIASVTTSFTDTDDVSKETTFKFGVTSNNDSLDLDIDNTTKTVTMNLVWGTF